MAVFEWGLIGGITASIAMLFFTLYFLVSSIITNSKLKKLNQNEGKRKKKQKKQKKILKKQRKKAIRKIFIFLILTMMLSGGSLYISFYRSTNLSTEGSDLIVRSHYLIKDLSEQLNEIEKGSADEEEVTQNIQYLATTLASYGTKTASHINTSEGQSILNKYYNGLKELGVNLSTQAHNLYENPTRVEEFKKDLKRVNGLEDKAFSYYKVNKAALKE